MAQYNAIIIIIFYALGSKGSRGLKIKFKTHTKAGKAIIIIIIIIIIYGL